MMPDDQIESASNTNFAMELHQLLEDFINQIGKRFDEVQQFLILVDNHLTTIKLARGKEGATTTVAIAMLECARVFKKLEEETKSVIASACCAFLSSNMMDPQSSSMPENVQEVTNNLLTSTMLDAIAKPSPPPERSTRPMSIAPSLHQQPFTTKLSTPAYDDSTDLLSWLDRL